jgi:hypothetical protein
MSLAAIGIIWMLSLVNMKIPNPTATTAAHIVITGCLKQTSKALSYMRCHLSSRNHSTAAETFREKSYRISGIRSREASSACEQLCNMTFFVPCQIRLCKHQNRTILHTAENLP